ncbi:hypothetical protein GCM10007870_03440 [Gluconobacter kondonii]|uniref:Uncharacterized protein n=1 Tax=Gluconobacter kondonii TaxID=941463 RepID=A0ABQ5WP82_9PROT|nr:hypothetical protein GCM10007870_03440 [Gluconobacter kondonii]
MATDQPTRLDIHPCPATRRKDAGWSIKQALDDAAFAVAKRRFAMACKDFGNRAPGRAFDFDVRIDERQAADLGEAPSDGGFASTHHPDEDNRA